MTNLKNKLYADYLSDHIMMTYPWMHEKKTYFNNLILIYKSLSKILIENNINITLVLPEDRYDVSCYKEIIKEDSNIIKHNCDDIWIRDYYPKLYYEDNSLEKKIIKYSFNGYGRKYPYKNDDGFKHKVKKHKAGIDMNGIILEGGNLEFSSNGVLLSNKSCMKKNNTELSSCEILDRINSLKEEISISEIFYIELDPIIGDDTNGHIDNFVRFINDETIVYFASKDKTYNNYCLARELESQIKGIAKKSRIINNIIPIYHDVNDLFIKDDKILPYSKLNFVTTKNCIIFPSINNNEDKLYNEISKVLTNENVYTINSEASLQENGGLHCLTTNI